MTNYSPLHDAIDSNGNCVTPSDMVAEGYNDFNQRNDTESARMHIISALDALDGQMFDDPAKWHIVNELVGALVELDEHEDTETTVTSDGQMMSLSTEER